jgi:hypothetical protein
MTNNTFNMFRKYFSFQVTFSLLFLTSSTALLIQQSYPRYQSRFRFIRLQLDQQSNLGKGETIFGKSVNRLLDEAQKLRGEASELEKNVDSSTKSITKTDQPPYDFKDFISTSGLALKLCNETGLGSDGQNVSNLSRPTTPQQQYTSVLTDRSDEVAKRKTTLDKLSGELMKSLSSDKVADSTRQNESSITKSLPEQLKAATQLLDQTYKEIQPWYFRAIIKLGVSTLLLDTERMSDMQKLDAAILEVAFIIELQRTAQNVIDDAESNIAYNDWDLDALRNRTFDKADSIKASLKIPAHSIEYLREAIATDEALRDTEASSELILWYKSIVSAADAERTTDINAGLDLKLGNTSIVQPSRALESESATANGLDAVADAMERFMKENVNEASSCAAENFLLEYFDWVSRWDGPAISRDGAGRFQSEILREYFDVSAVKMYSGAVIYDVIPKTNDFADLVQKIDARLMDSPMKDEIAFIALQNDRYPSLDDGIAQALMETLLKTGPAVVAFPKAWNSTVDATLKNPTRVWLRELLSTSAALSSATFAANSFQLFENAAFTATGALPPDFIPMAVAPLFLHYAASIAETIAGKLRNFDVKTMIVPSFTLFTFGSRSTYTSRPKTRNDMFDVAAIGLATSLLSSFALLWLGLDLTAQASSEALLAFPSVPLALVDINAVVSQVVNYHIPGALESLPDGAASGLHIHWLAVVGACSFVVNLLQLFPVDNSAGSKLCQAVFGIGNFAFVNAVAGLVKFIFLVPILISLATGVSPVITKAKLLLDYFLISQITSSNEVRHNSYFPYLSKTNSDSIFKLIFVTPPHRRIRSLSTT